MSDTIRTREFTADGVQKISATILQTGRRLSSVLDSETPHISAHQQMAEDVAQSPVELLAVVPGGYTWRSLS